MRKYHLSGHRMYKHIRHSDGPTMTEVFIMPWHEFVLWYVRSTWYRHKRRFAKPYVPPPPRTYVRRPKFTIPSEDNVAERFHKAVGRTDKWVPIAEAIGAVDRMDELERISLWHDWMIDEALFSSMPVIEDGFARPFLWRDAPKMTLAEFFAPRGDRYVDPHLSAAHRYYQRAKG